MKTRVSEFQLLSEQDYGPWLDRLTLWEKDGVYYLEEEFGYSRPYDSEWYVLDAKPVTSVEEAFKGSTGGLCGTGDTSEFEYALGVRVTPCEPPC